MYSISDKFKESVYAPVRTTKARVTFDISDTTIANDTITTAVTSEFAVSAKAQLTDKKREQNYNIATCELDRFKLDGSFTFADDTLSNNGQVGWCSNPLCDSSGLFTPNQVLTFTFGSTHSSMGITVTFDVLNNEYATDYTIKAYDASNAIITTVDYIGNDKVQVASLGQFYLYKKIEIIIKKWSKPYRRARVCEVDFGVVRVYQDDNLIRCSLIEDMDITTGQLPSPEFKFTVDNASREFNILNPSGFYKFLQQRQQVLAELGVVTGSNCEYVPLGNYLLWDWTSDEGSITASFTARTNLDIMSGYSYENLVAKSSYSLYQMAVDIFTECGITNYQIDTALQSILTNGLIKKIDCRSAIQMIAIAGCANIFVTRDNKITLKLNSTSLGSNVDEIDMDNMYKEPQIVLDKVVKSVEVTYYTDLNTKTIVSVTNSGVIIGDVLKVETNTLINTSARATAVGNWLLIQKNYRAIYTMNWRGNPAHELNDIVLIENTYGLSKKAAITKTEITYQGYLSAKTEARGLSDIVD